MADAVHQFGNISLGSSGGLSQGQLKITPAGLAWKKASGGRVVEIKKEEISSLCWTKVSRGCQFGVSRIGASTINFLGFRDKDLEGIAPFCQKSYGLEIKDQSMSTSGRNWGNLAIDGGSLTFIVDGRVAFQLPLPDVSQAQQVHTLAQQRGGLGKVLRSTRMLRPPVCPGDGYLVLQLLAVKDDLVLELLADDTALDDRADALAEVAFHVPTSNTSFPTRENGDVPAKVLLDAVLEQTDAGAATASEVVCTFSEVGVVTPRGRFEVEMHLGFLSLTGQTQDFKIRYTSIMRIFILPKSNSPHTLVVISLDPPIRKGQTHYNHLLCQFPTDTEEEVNLEISDEALAAKNEKIGGKLTRNVRGPTFEVFAKVLRGLSSARITKPGAFKDVAGDGSCVRCSYKADDGHLYPLDRAFFYVPKPPLMVPFEDIESVEFARQGGGVISSSVRTFDLVVRMRNDTEHQFRNIQRTEWQNLFEFIKSRKIRIENLASAQQGPGGPGKAVDLGDDVDPGMRRAEAEADSEDDDEDFQAGEDSGSSDGELDSANGSGSGSDDVEMVDEEGITVADVADNKKKRKGKEGGAAAEGANKDGGGGGSSKAAGGSKAAGSSKPAAAAPAKKEKKAKGGGDEDGPAKKKARKKKDPNAPKGVTSAFMYFSAAQRDKVKADNPGIAFGEVGKVLGERWKALSVEDKVPYDEKATKDKARYKSQMEEYKKKAAGGDAEETAAVSDDGEEGGDDE